MSPELGLIMLRRIDHHAAEPNDELGSCGICGAPVWTNRKVQIFVDMNPHLPALCCCCGLDRVILTKIIDPRVNFVDYDIPDLAARGHFN